MNTKLIAGGLLAGAFLLPIAAYADSDAGAVGSSAKTYVKDSVITAKVKAQLADEKLSSLVNVRVDTDNKGAVTLSGTAASRDAASKAVAIARAVEGVTSVENRIKIDDVK